MWSIRDVTGTVAFDFQCYRWEITDAWFVQGRAWWCFAVMFLYLFGWKGIKLPVGKQKLNNHWSDLSIIQIVDAWWDHDKPYTPYRLKEIKSCVMFRHRLPVCILHCFQMLMMKIEYYSLPSCSDCSKYSCSQIASLCSHPLECSWWHKYYKCNRSVLPVAKVRGFNEATNSFLCWQNGLRDKEVAYKEAIRWSPQKKTFVSNLLCTRFEYSAFFLAGRELLVL